MVSLAQPDDGSGSSSWKVTDLVMLGVGCTMMAVHAVMLLQWARRAGCASWRQLRLASLAQSLWSWVRTSSSEKDYPHVAEVEHLVAERRVNLSKYMYKQTTRCFVLIEAMLVLNILTNTPRFLTDGLIVAFNIGFFILTAISVRPSLLNICTLQIVYCLCMAVHTVAMTPLVVYKAALPSLSQSMVGVRILGGLTSLNIPLVGLWESIYLITVTTSYHFGKTDCTQMPYTSTYVIGELVGCVCMMLLLSSIKGAMRMHARQEIEARSARNETSAVSALLSTMGDAVVELDEKLQIVGNSAQLATMLLQGPSHDLSGTPFEQLLAGEEDVKLFKEYMVKEVPVDQTLADVFHVKVRDCLRNFVRVEIFHVCKKSIGFRQNDHLLGIREDTDFEREDEMQAFGVSVEPVAAMALTGPTSSKLPDGPEVMASINALTFEILDVSGGLIAFVGQRPANDHFSEWMATSTRIEFMKHFRSKVNKWMATMNTQESSVRFTYKNMKLKIPLSGSGQHPYFRVSATCTMVLRSQGIGPEGEGRPVVEAVFTDLDTNVAPSSTKRGSRRKRNKGDGDESSGSLADSHSEGGERTSTQSRPPGTEAEMQSEARKLASL